MADKRLANAKVEKNDEFYTSMSDIEVEMKYYRSQFKDKIILCNCDDPYESNFFKYFAMNFNFLGLKKLIATCYNGSPVAYTQLSIFDLDEATPKSDRVAYKVEITKVEDMNGDGAIDLADVEAMLQIPGMVQRLEGNGDFRSKECIELLKEADIVVTNPPFSLFREYLSQLIFYNKHFIIIGNQNAITYQEVFPLIQQNKIWLGITMNGSNRYFRVPDDYPLTESSGKIIDGIKYAFVKSVVWFTNLKNQKWTDEIVLYKKYQGNEEEYPKYDNYDAINVDKYNDIPMDYDGVMGVPITFLHKYNPNQFSIVGITTSPLGNHLKTKIYPKQLQHSKNGEIKQVMKLNDNPAIKIPQPLNNETYYEIDGEYYATRYARILIRKK